VCTPDHKHGQGATATTRLPIQEVLDGNNVSWMEKMPDEKLLTEDKGD